jgi:8-oxo-dGTP pyrophosphatase MutT (NUDIX family)
MGRLIPNGKETVLFEGEMFQVISKPYLVVDDKKTNGKPEKENHEIARRSPGVRLLITRNRSLYLLTKEWRTEVGATGGFDYRLPGGKVFGKLKDYELFLDSGKDILPFAIEAAKREAKQEAGIFITRDPKLIRRSPAGSSLVWDLYYFLVEEFEVGEASPKKGEFFASRESRTWRTFEDVKRLCLQNRILEDRSMGVLLKFILEQDK